jgi:zinc transport system permease protein
MLDQMLSLPFIQRALVGGLLVVVMLSLLSFFVVLRRISFVGVGISHSALGGVAVGIALGSSTMLTTTIFCAAVAFLIGFISRHGHLREDAAIGITFPGTMALGIVLITLAGGYLSSLFSFLFGSVLSISRTDIYVIAVYCGAVVAFISIFFKSLLNASFDEELARAAGAPVAFLHYLLLIMIALAIVASMKLVGIILVSAMLVLPAATGYQLAQTYRKVLALSMVSGVVALLAGLVLSYRFNLPSGATIVLCACAIFFACFAFSPRRRQKARLAPNNEAKPYGGHDVSQDRVKGS